MGLAGALINWSNRDRNIGFDPSMIQFDGGEVVGLDFWQEQTISLDGNRWKFNVPGHGVRLLQLRRRDPSHPLWLGDTLHISGGDVVKSWQVESNELQAQLDLGGSGAGRVWLELPDEPSKIPIQSRRFGLAAS